MRLWCCFILCLILSSLLTSASGQEIDNTGTYKNINADRYIRLSGDDDFLSGTDDQYTEGASLEVCAPWVKKFPLTKLLLHPPLDNLRAKYGISIEQEGYTPVDLKSETISLNDRPFASALFLNTFMITTDYEHKQRFASMLSTGVIGPASKGNEIQISAHIMLANHVPTGWKYQVHNDVVLNYELSYQRQVYSYGHLLSVDADIMTRVGTLNDKVCPGLTIMAGYFDDPFSMITHQKKYRFYIYDHPEVSFVGYDATMQGGVFDNGSPYTLSANDIARMVFKNIMGFAFAYNGLNIEYYHCYQTKQFLAGQPHSWDGMQITLAFK